MKSIITTLCLFIALSTMGQQPLTLPVASPYNSTTHRVGITDITVTYHSPAVKGREIWGSLVPYNEIWRVGADENTTVSFTHNVSIGGKPLPAGTYGLHMIPTQEKWTVIFSKNHTSWGSFFYQQDEDALRTEVATKAHPFTEWLTYNFIPEGNSSVVLSLQWEKLEIPVKIDVDVNEIVFQNIKNELRSPAGFTWQGWYDGANYCIQNGVHYDEAANWLDVADRSNPNNFSIIKAKASLKEIQGDSATAKKLITNAITVANEDELNRYGYELMGKGQTQEALVIFKTNVKNHPKSWNAHDSYAEALNISGNKKEALKEYETALKNNPPENQVKRIEGILKK